jgi:hypothetical protein
VYNKSHPLVSERDDAWSVLHGHGDERAVRAGADEPFGSDIDALTPTTATLA